ncbi:DEKNAAC102735 [Brettanomyces naardenensis]|uniref:DEKNAAC102735 n=1 Tax=Brettanomyces naardenensis TaxID=13370 RepID=A0A448YLB0_BRENA|nr:DEKNAAC102735 [Brettanomyces naardenensis]
MQLEGELSTARGPKVYKNPFQAFWLIFKNEGFHGIQKGLFASYLYQIGLNSCRLGLYEPIRKSINSFFYPDRKAVDVQNLGINVLSGILTGAFGCLTSSPFFLLKTRMQSFSEHVKIGQQSHYESTWHGLKTIYGEEGFKGLFRGVDAAILRTAAGSAAQLPSYNFAKQELMKTGYFQDGTELQLISSLFAGFGVTVVMNPFDVVMTRIYNQRGDLYKGPIDCFVKTVETEGPRALYKGFVAQLLRNAPHTVLLLVFMEQTMKMVYTVENQFRA